MTKRGSVVVVGGGLAGLTAAAYLAPTHDVTVVEAAARVGGQCAGEWVGNAASDFGVHGIYPRYMELNKVLAMTGGSCQRTIPAGGQHIVTPDARLSPVRMPRLPAPLHCAVHAVLLRAVPPRERIKLAAGAVRLLGLSAETLGLDDVSILEVAQRVGIPRDAFRIVFEPLAWIGFFLRPQELSAGAYLSALRFLITGRSDSWRARWVPTPNGETLVRPLVKFINTHNGRILVETRVTGFSHEGMRVTSVRVADTDGLASSLPGDWFVCAVPPLAAAPIVDTLPQGCPLAISLRRLGTTHVWTTRFWFEPGPPPALRHGVVLTDTSGFVFFVLNLFMPGYEREQERVIEVQCGPDAVGLGEHALQERVRCLLIDSQSARLLKEEVTSAIPYARYALGSEMHRPHVYSLWPNVFFAGDWVHDPLGRWFMERAASTGRAAAHAICGLPAPALAPCALEAMTVKAARLCVGRRNGVG